MKKYLPILRSSPFFKGLKDNEILSILHCVNATVISKERDSYIFRAGDSTDVMGLVVSGGVLVIKEDLWGHRNILSKCHAGDFFGEPYAASSGAVLNISVVADEDCEIVFLNVQRLLITCSTACEHHQKLIRNLVSVLANKILILNDKITHVGKRTTRDKLLSYLSAESIRHAFLRALITIRVSSVSSTSQPTIQRLYQSITAVRYRNPCLIGIYVMSIDHA